MKLEEERYIDALKRNHLSSKERADALGAIAATKIRCHGHELAFSYIPLLLNGRDIAYFSEIADTVDRILSKVTKRYLEDPAYRKLFEFSEQAEKLILLPCNYEAMIPVGRHDIFFDGNTGEYQFCEFNTDGSGGMSWGNAVSAAVLNSFYDPDFIQKYKIRPFCVVERIASELLRIYRTDANAVEHPTFCITDFREEGVLTDFEAFVQAFRQQGIEARFTDIRDLKFDGQNLYDATDGTVIHAIYRRAVTSVVLEHLDECQGLIRAAEAEKVVLLGHFRTTVAHSKMIHVVLNREETLKMLDSSDREWVKNHIPYTCCLEEETIGKELLSDIYCNKDSWVLKPREGFASHGVVCGMDMPEGEWKDFIIGHFGKGYLVQRFCKRYPVPVLTALSDKITAMPLMTGIYCCDGHFAGCYNRAGNAGTIDYAHDGLCVPAMMCGEVIPAGLNIGVERENLRVRADNTLCESEDPLSEYDFMTKDFAEQQMELVSPVFPSEEEVCRWLTAKTRVIREKLQALNPPERIWPFSAPPVLGNENEIRIAVMKDKAAETYRRYLAEKYGKKKMLFSGLHVNFSAKEMATVCYGEGDPKDLTEWRNRFCLNAAAGYAEYGWLVTVLTAASPTLDGSYFSPDKKGRTVITKYASCRCSEIGYWNNFIPDISFQSIEAYADSVKRHIKNKDIVSESELYFPVRLKPEAGGSLDSLKKHGIDHVEIRNVDLNPFEESGLNLDDLKFMSLFWKYLGCTFSAATQRPDSGRWTENFKKAAGRDLEHTLITKADGKDAALLEYSLHLLEQMHLFYSGFDRETGRLIDAQKRKLLQPKLRYAEIPLLQSKNVML